MKVGDVWMMRGRSSDVSHSNILVIGKKIG